jgi:hypothetical protein
MGLPENKQKSTTFIGYLKPLWKDTPTTSSVVVPVLREVVVDTIHRNSHPHSTPGSVFSIVNFI